MEIDIFCQMRWNKFGEKRLVSEIHKIIKYNKFPITPIKVRNITRPCNLTLGKDTVGGRIECQQA
jgi:hypothetical protein